VPTLLYLDTARLGLMSERASNAHQAYVRLAGKEGASLYFDRFLRDGFRAWPRPLQRSYPQLSDWEGIGELKQSLLSLLGLKREAPIFLANRSSELMRFAARELVTRSRRILITDLTWPHYRRLLEQERVGSNVGLTSVAIRDSILHDSASSEDIARCIVGHYEQRNCDGMFLPAVSREGIRLPIERILMRIRRSLTPRFVVVDGAQAFCHVPIGKGIHFCDILLAGCHKWLQGHVPMGLAFLPNPKSASSIRSACHRMLATNELDDPLLTFTGQLENDSLESYSETVSLASLFTCRAAITAKLRVHQSLAKTLKQRIHCATILADTIHGTGWDALLPQAPFRTGMLLAKREQSNSRYLASGRLRSFFLDHGIALTTYDCGIIRFSVPHRTWRQGELDLIRWTLQWSSGGHRSSAIVCG
jgi:hypothetical protein